MDFSDYKLRCEYSTVQATTTPCTVIVTKNSHLRQTLLQIFLNFFLVITADKLEYQMNENQIKEVCTTQVNNW